MVTDNYRLDGLYTLQNPKPIPPQGDMPSSIELMQLSWDRSKGYMRIIIEEVGEWNFTEVSGAAQMISTDVETGRLYIRASASLDDGALTLTRDPIISPHAMLEDADIHEVLNPALYRLCWRRQVDAGEEHMWQVWREALFPNHHRLVRNYAGDVAIRWPSGDEAPHIFHQGLVVISKDEIAHLYDLSLKDYF